MTHVAAEAVCADYSNGKQPDAYLSTHVRLKGEEVKAGIQTLDLSLRVPCYRLGAAFPWCLLQQ